MLFVPFLPFLPLARASQFPVSSRVFDIQGHRGSRGSTVENLLPSFAWALIDGASTLELDNGITKDGHVVAWHDNQILPTKCKETKPAYEDDPQFPYVGKFIANLTLAQIKTLDCGSLRSPDFPMQLTYPGTKISTMSEVFAFVTCVDTHKRIRWNIESKIDAENPEHAQGVDDFVSKQLAAIRASSYRPSQITYQSFDWRTLIGMKARQPDILTSALVELSTVVSVSNWTYPWLGNVNLDSFPGLSLDIRVAQAAASIDANILSPAVASSEGSGVDASDPNFRYFTTPAMIEEAHGLGMKVIPWTANRATIAEVLVEWGVDGIISDYPGELRRWLAHQGEPVAPKAFPKRRVLECLNEHLQTV